MKKEANLQYTPGMFNEWKSEEILDRWDHFSEIMWGLGYDLDYFESFEKYRKQSKLNIKEPHSEREERRNTLYLLEHADRQIVGNYLFSKWRSYTRMDYYTCDEYGLDFLRRVIAILESKYENMWKNHESLTSFIPSLEKGAFGEWAKQYGDGTAENPFTFPFVLYSQDIYHLEDAVYKYTNDHQCSNYGQILKENGLKWDAGSMENADVSKLDGRATTALLLAAFRAEKFCDGALLSFCKSGAILRWLRRLKEIDDEEC